VTNDGIGGSWFDSQPTGRPWSAGTNGRAWKPIEIVVADEEERRAATLRGVETSVMAASGSSRARRRAMARKLAWWP